MKIEIIRARVNVKSLAAEAKIIRKEMNKTSDPFNKNDLRNHSISSVRPEARLAHLAMQFLKKKPRHICDKGHKPIDLYKLTRKINLFVMGYSTDSKWWKISMGEVEDWYNKND